MAGPLPCVGARVQLRRLRPADLPAFQAYRGDAELARYQGWQPMNGAAAAAFLEEAAATPFCPPGAWCQIGIAAVAGDALLGDIGLNLAADGRALEIGITLARGAQGAGHAGEALRLAVAAVFAHTAAARVVAVTDVRNTPSVRLLQRGGFRRCATLDALFKGEVCREHHFVQHRPGHPDHLHPRLRPAEAADAPGVARVLLDSRAALMPFAPSAHSDDGVRAWVAGTLLPGGGVSVALVDGRVEGVLATSQAAGVSWIDQLYVHPTQVGAGLGRALLARALATLPRPVRLFTFQANEAARAFYERRGFAVRALGDGRDNEEACPDVLYELPAVA